MLPKTLPAVQYWQQCFNSSAQITRAPGGTLQHRFLSYILRLGLPIPREIKIPSVNFPPIFLASSLLVVTSKD